VTGPTPYKNGKMLRFWEFFTIYLQSTENVYKAIKKAGKIPVKIQH